MLVTADAKPGIGLNEEALARLLRLEVQDGSSEALPAVWMALASSCPSTADAATTAAAPAAAPAAAHVDGTCACVLLAVVG